VAGLDQPVQRLGARRDAPPTGDQVACSELLKSVLSVFDVLTKDRKIRRNARHRPAPRWPTPRRGAPATAVDAAGRRASYWV